MTFLEAVLQFVWDNPLTTIFVVGVTAALAIWTTPHNEGTTGPG
jgi:hypothetical protein